MNKENMIDIYNRTFNNCVFYKGKGDNKHLLNEIGVLRGIVYCIESIIGEENLNNVIDFHLFVDMINTQNQLY